MTSDYTLHCFLESGNSYKPALMLQLTQSSWQPQWVDFFNGSNRTPEFRALNPMGEVPVLIDHSEDDLVLTQSGVMLYHIGRKTGQYMPESPAEEREVMRWMLFDNHKLTGNLATWRFMHKFMKQEGEPVTEFLKGRTMTAIKVVERHLGGQDWLAGSSPTIADISACGYLFWPDHVGLDWNDFPAIKRWLQRIENLKHWAAPEEILPSKAA